MTGADLAEVRDLALKDAGLTAADLPDIDSNVLSKRVIEDRGTIVCAAIARVEAMTHLYLDHAWSTPRMRWEAFRLLHGEICRELAEKGIEIIHAQVRSRAFARRLRELGWEDPEAEQVLLKIARDRRDRTRSP